MRVADDDDLRTLGLHQPGLQLVDVLRLVENDHIARDLRIGQRPHLEVVVVGERQHPVRALLISPDAARVVQHQRIQRSVLAALPEVAPPELTVSAFPIPLHRSLGQLHQLRGLHLPRFCVGPIAHGHVRIEPQLPRNLFREAVSAGDGVEFAAVARHRLQCLPGEGVHGVRAHVPAEHGLGFVGDGAVERDVGDLLVRHAGGDHPHRGGLAGTRQRPHRDVLALQAGVDDGLLLRRGRIARRPRRCLGGFPGIQTRQHIPDGLDRLIPAQTRSGRLKLPDIALLWTPPEPVGFQRLTQLWRIVLVGAADQRRGTRDFDADTPRPRSRFRCGHSAVVGGRLRCSTGLRRCGCRVLGPWRVGFRRGWGGHVVRVGVTVSASVRRRRRCRVLRGRQRGGLGLVRVGRRGILLSSRLHQVCR